MKCSSCGYTAKYLSKCCKEPYCSIGCQRLAFNSHRFKCSEIGNPFQHTEETRRMLEDAINFDKFVKENATKVKLSQTYDINDVELFNWTRQVAAWSNNNDVIAFANTVEKNLIHVSFTELFTQLRHVGKEILTLIEPFPNRVVVMIIDGGYRKSNVWIAQLLWQFIGSEVNLIVDRPSSIPSELWEQKLFVIHPDDMSYSGNQIMGTLFSVEDSIEDYPNATYILALPYISTSAVNAITSVIPLVKILKSTQRIQNFDENLSDMGYKAFSVMQTMHSSPWRELYAIQPTHALIYFDHKLADSVSIPSKLVAGPIAYNPNTKEIRKFNIIRNCENAIYKTETGSIVDATTYVTDFDDMFTCPLAFYKQIDYTWKGKSLIQDADLSIVEILRK